jgi:hypothetical protein
MAGTADQPASVPQARQTVSGASAALSTAGKRHIVDQLAY